MRGWEERGPALFQVQREFQGLGFRVQDEVWGLVFFDVDISTRIFTISDTNLPKKKETWDSLGEWGSASWGVWGAFG